MTIDEVKELMAQFDQSTVREFDLKEGTFSLYMNKNEENQKKLHTSQTTEEPTESKLAVVEKTATSQVDTTEKATAIEETNPSIDSTNLISSPIVGIVYLKPAPEKENFVTIGTKVKKGDIVCIIEAMKLMNEITAQEDGIITEILAANEEVVEFGQPLFRFSKGVE